MIIICAYLQQQKSERRSNPNLASRAFACNLTICKLYVDIKHIYCINCKIFGEGINAPIHRCLGKLKKTYLGDYQTLIGIHTLARMFKQALPTNRYVYTLPNFWWIFPCVATLWSRAIAVVAQNYHCSTLI